MAEIIKNGFRIDDETGEVLGLAVYEMGFTVNNLETAEWVLNKFAEVEAEKLALVARRDALIANINYQIEQVEKRENWLHARFTVELKCWAEKQLEGVKQRFVQTAYGRLKFRKTPGSITVLNQEKAVFWLKWNYPDAIKTTESVLVSSLKERTDLPADLFNVSGPGETFKIETGVKP